MAISEKLSVAGLLLQRTTQNELTLKNFADKHGEDYRELVHQVITGKCKLPINMIYPVALALGVDPTVLLRVALNEYHEGIYDALERCLTHPLLSQMEIELVMAMRKVSGETDPQILVFEEGRRLLAVAVA